MNAYLSIMQTFDIESSTRTFSVDYSSGAPSESFAVLTCTDRKRLDSFGITLPLAIARQLLADWAAGLAQDVQDLSEKEGVA